MTTIVMNTLNGAVTEYGWAFNSITPTHAGNSTALYTLGGETNAGAAITGEVRTGRTNQGTTLGKAIDGIYFARVGGAGTALVETPSATYEYAVPAATSGVARAQPGRGINENYLAFGYRNVAGADFRLDHMEPVLVLSKDRRAKS